MNYKVSRCNARNDQTSESLTGPSGFRGEGAGNVILRFPARDPHLVLGPGKNGKAWRFRIRIDGPAPGEDHGGGTDEKGDGIVKEYQLYQLVQQKGKVEGRTFEIEFLDHGV